MQAWNGFKTGVWQEHIDVRDFIQTNYTPYVGGEEFLQGVTAKTAKVWAECEQLLKAEYEAGGVLDVGVDKISTITSYTAGFIDKDNEVVVGLQTDAPLKRGVIVKTGIRMAEQACQDYGYELNHEISEIYNNHRVTHNTAVFATYTDEMRAARSAGIITGLPDAYGRGRIIGDYRRVALYGIDRLIAGKKQDGIELAGRPMLEETIRLRGELSLQIGALKEMLVLGQIYGCDLSRPAANAYEAVQWTYLAYLAGIKEQNGAAMSIGRISSFLDIYIERDLATGVIDETQAQELIDQMVIKLRLARHLRTHEYNDLFAGDPMWITEAIGGMGQDGRTLVTKNSFRILHTLYNLGAAPEPNLTVLWSEQLPQNFKNYCAKAAIDTSSIQFENDDLMRPAYGDDYSIACCVSAMRTGKDQQLFGARANLAKAMLMAINGGRDEKQGRQIAPVLPVPQGEYLDYKEVRANFSQVLQWLTGLYVDTMNVIHYMHDKYAYEGSQMALHDTQVNRLMAFGIAGLSVVLDSLSAIRYAQVKPIRNAEGLAVDFEVQGEYPCFGNNDQRVDSMAKELTQEFIEGLRKHRAYRDAEHTLSVLTITSNVMYGKKTGKTPDGREAGVAFAPGANPMHGRDKSGVLAALKSICNIDYEDCRDGISYTFSVLPATLGKTEASRTNNMVAILDAYAKLKGHHINVNVLERAVLEDAMQQPQKYPQLTIRVSGYAVHFIKLSKMHQLEVISRTMHEVI